jgi:hypothetical protein
MTARMLLAFTLIFNSDFACALNAQKAHVLIKQQAPELLGDGSQLVSVYYFGHSDDLSVVGLERVGDDYLPIRWLVVFNKETMLGWSYPILEFPVRFENGHLIFPKGASVEDISLLPAPPKTMIIESQSIPFYTPKSIR